MLIVCTWTNWNDSQNECLV